MASVAAKKRKSGVDIKIEENWEPDVTVPPREPDGDDNDDEPDNVAEGSSQTKEVVAALCKQRLIPSDLELQLQQYFKERPRIKPLPLSQSCVDIDLTDPDEETWIIQCPASVDVKAELMNKKLNLTAPRSTIKNCSVPLEAHVQYNRNERVVGLQSGTRVKSFVPVGFVRIHEALPPLAEPVLQDASNVSDVTVPYPEELRERHPLLGYDFKEYLALPKRVRKRLALAQQKAELLYKNTPLVASKQSPQTADNARTAGTGEQTVSVKPVPAVGTPSKSRKRKEPPPVEENALEIIPIKQEPPSPKRKKQQNDEEVQTVSVKQEVTMEDDISWLLNI
uniref:Uncharacterized protein n=1 Tax=Anopheles arabiensis TaxID=7173 RepID=A0A182HVI1_ANOAR